jgi:hypothetical protein
MRFRDEKPGDLDRARWAGERFGPVDGSWIASGYSNGACWAINAAQRRPDVFGAVAAFSAGLVPHRITGPARAASVRHYLAAGTLERGFRRSTSRRRSARLSRRIWASRRLRCAGMHTTLHGTQILQDRGQQRDGRKTCGWSGGEARTSGT